MCHKNQHIVLHSTYQIISVHISYINMSQFQYVSIKLLGSPWSLAFRLCNSIADHKDDQDPCALRSLRSLRSLLMISSVRLGRLRRVVEHA